MIEDPKIRHLGTCFPVNDREQALFAEREQLATRAAVKMTRADVNALLDLAFEPRYEWLDTSLPFDLREYVVALRATLDANAISRKFSNEFIGSIGERVCTHVKGNISVGEEALIIAGLEKTHGYVEIEELAAAFGVINGHRISRREGRLDSLCKLLRGRMPRKS